MWCIPLARITCQRSAYVVKTFCGEQNMRRFLSQQAMNFLRRFSSAGVNFLPIFRLLWSNSGVVLRFLALLLALGFAIPGQADPDLQPASVKRLRVVVFGD